MTPRLRGHILHSAFLHNLRRPNRAGNGFLHPIIGHVDGTRSDHTTAGGDGRQDLDRRQP